jgi:AraC-like DNA-binding protein
LRTTLGPGWYLRLPALWSLDVHGDLEGAMRFAPNLGEMLRTIERYGSVRWPLARWQLRTGRRHALLTAVRTDVIPEPDWQMLVAIFFLTLIKVLEVAYPDAARQVAAELEGPIPVTPAEADAVFQVPVKWGAAVSTAFIPLRLLEMPSALADPRGYAAMLIALEAQIADEPERETLSVKVANLLGHEPNLRLRGVELAKRLGLSLRTLERNLAREGTTLRQQRDTASQTAFRALLRRPEHNLATIAERLGYSDESALSRATRRWFGYSAAEARKRLRVETPIKN